MAAPVEEGDRQSLRESEKQRGRKRRSGRVGRGTRGVEVRQWYPVARQPVARPSVKAAGWRGAPDPPDLELGGRCSGAHD